APLDSIAFHIDGANQVELLPRSTLGLNPEEWFFYIDLRLCGHCLAAAVRVPSKRPCRFVLHATKI
ncbi:MAG: hypothetical protein MUC50_23650, partial [Myxococcota bacterium]|nr:hypothetical protein [Myxococcota bacterium]